MKINYSTQCTTTKLPEIRNFIAKQLKSISLSSKEKHLLILAIDEACANAIIHGNNCDKNKNLDLVLEIEEDKILVQIYDIGNYHPNKTTWSGRNIVIDNIRCKRKGGLGLTLIYRAMDRVKYYNRGQVTVCELVKLLSDK